MLQEDAEDFAHIHGRASSQTYYHIRVKRFVRLHRVNHISDRRIGLHVVKHGNVQPSLSQVLFRLVYESQFNQVLVGDDNGPLPLYLFQV